MNLHEYQAKELFRHYGISVPNGKVAFSVHEAVDAAKSLNGDRVIVKAQVHAGGRGKAGGVKIVDSAAEAGEVARAMLGNPLTACWLKKPATLPTSFIWVLYSIVHCAAS
jgi:succinyl-CoA synthetase beta subunit